MYTKILTGLVLTVLLVDAGIYVSHLHNIQIPERPANSSPSRATPCPLDQLEAPITTAGDDMVQSDSPVAFQFLPSPARGEETVWNATYASAGHTARFRVEFDAPRKGSKPSDIVIHAGDGHIFSVTGSDSSSLLNAIATELQTKNRPAQVVRNISIPFSYAVLGEHDSKRKGGGFSCGPTGDWTAMKIFLGDNTDEDEGEVYLNFNSRTHQAEFAIKDPDYGDIVFKHLATVL